MLSYCRVEVLQGAEASRVIEHVMTALESRVSVGELEAAMKQGRGVHVGEYAVRMTAEEGGYMRRVRWEGAASECQALILASDLTDVPTMMILVAAMFLLPLGLVALYLYVSGVFTNRRAFQFGFYILLVFFALTIGIGIHSCQGYDLPATTPVSLSEVLPEPCAALQHTRWTPPSSLRPA